MNSHKVAGVQNALFVRMYARLENEHQPKSPRSDPAVSADRVSAFIYFFVCLV